MASCSKVGEKSEALGKTSLNLNMLNDRKTEMYIKFAKVMLIFQGPIDDNIALIKSLGDKFRYSCRIVSENTYKRETSIAFCPENTETFYRYFRERVKKSCEEGYNLIVIESSMSNSNQIRYYFFLAQTFQYVVIPVPTQVTKQVNFPIISSQARSYDKRVKYPNFFKHHFCGWFLHDVDSAELREEASLYAKDCFNILDFDDIYSKVCKPNSFKAYYGMEDKRQYVAYCIVKIFNNDIDSNDYISSELFRKFYGRMSKLYIVGFIISPHMIAARVKLTYDQKPLWSMPDDLIENFEPTVYPSKLISDNKIEIKNENISLLSSKSNRTLVSGQINHSPLNTIPHNAKGRSCHILLGKVKGAPERNVDYDVPFAVFRERKTVPKYSDKMKPYDLDRSLVRRIGKYWFIYLKETIILNGLFATYCSAESNIA